MSPSLVLSSLSERRVCGLTASSFGRGGIEGDLRLSVVLHLFVDLAFVDVAFGDMLQYTVYIISFFGNYVTVYNTSSF